MHTEVGAKVDSMEGNQMAEEDGDPGQLPTMGHLVREPGHDRRVSKDSWQADEKNYPGGNGRS